MALADAEGFTQFDAPGQCARAGIEPVEAKPGAEEVKFIRGGRAEVQIWLTDKSSDALAKLKELGFEVVLDSKTVKLVIGRLPIENLQKLAELKYVRYVAPQISR
ncbi:MAG: hypothetical protein M3Q91_12680 [Acidobacteriota bacterium]|nr:hypothetical protein [Acidobacteriota bacterium]